MENWGSWKKIIIMEGLSGAAARTGKENEYKKKNVAVIMGNTCN